HLADYAGAKEQVERALDWTALVSLERTPVETAADEPLEDEPLENVSGGERSRSAARRPPVVVEPRPAWQVAHDLYRRAGLLSYAEGDYGRSHRFFEQAVALSFPPSRPQPPVEALLNRVAFQAENALPALPNDLDSAAPEFRVRLALAAVLLRFNLADAAQAHCDGVLQSREPEPSPEAESYAHLLRGKCLSRLGGSRGRSLALREYLAAQRSAPEAAWAAEALVAAGQRVWSAERDADKAAEHWRRVMEEYPQSSAAEEAAYRLAIAYESSERYTQARDAFEDLKERYPDSGFVKLADEHLKDIRRELPDAREPAANLPPVR
ncbi:MAG: tetratricopeptide repeat protein, partial [Planctomycetaceae bacterium]